MEQVKKLEENISKVKEHSSSWKFNFKFEKIPGFSWGLSLSIPVNGICFSMNFDDPLRVVLR